MQLQCKRMCHRVTSKNIPTHLHSPLTWNGAAKQPVGTAPAHYAARTQILRVCDFSQKFNAQLCQNPPFLSKLFGYVCIENKYRSSNAAILGLFVIDSIERWWCNIIYKVCGSCISPHEEHKTRITRWDWTDSWSATFVRGQEIFIVELLFPVNWLNF